MRIDEEKSDITKVDEDLPIPTIEENLGTVNIGSQEIPPLEENVNTLDTCPSEIPTESYVEETVFSQPCQLLDVIDNCSSRMLDKSGPCGADFALATNSSSFQECPGQCDNEAIDDKRADCGSEIKCSGSVSSPTEENVRTMDISSFEMGVKSAVEEPVYFQPCQIFDVDNCPRMPDMLDLCGEDLTAAFNSLECFGQTDNEGRDDTDIDSGSEIKSSGYLLSPITESMCAFNTNSFQIGNEGVDICTSRLLDVLDLEDVSFAVNSSTSAECSGQTVIEGRDDTRVDCGSETKCSSILPSASRRSSRVHKPIGKTQTKNITRKCRKTAKVPYPDKTTEVSFNSARRKRSCVSKPARSSIWGGLRNVNKLFAENSEIVLNEVQSQELQKSKGSRGNAKRNKVRSSGNSNGSRKSSQASAGCIRLKVKLGNEVIQSSVNVVIPAKVDTRAPTNGTTNECGTETVFGKMPEFSNLINCVNDKMRNEGTGQHNVGDSSVDCEGGTGEYGDEDLEGHLTVKDLDSSLILKKSTAGGYLGVSSAESGGGVNTDPGTSPDSEVINMLQDAEVGSRCQEDLHDSVLTSKGFSDLENLNCKRGNCIQEDRSPGLEGINAAIPLDIFECRQKVGNGSLNTADASTISSSSKEECSTELLPIPTETEVVVSRNVFKVESNREDKTSCSLDVGLGLPDSLGSKNLLPPTKTKGHKLSKCSKSGGGSKGSSKDYDSTRNRKGNVGKKKENQKKSAIKNEVKESPSDDTVCKMEQPLETGNNMVNDLGMTNTVNDIDSVNVSYLGAVSSGLGEQILPQRKAWVCCDDCHKWRRIPAALADSIGDSRWICKDNMDKAFGDCSIPQEKSNAEINAELELSDASGEEDASAGRLHYKDLESRPSRGPQPASFTCIPYNEFLHRSRRSQTIDEIMVCHCKPPLDGRMGCGDECLNRMLNIECLRGTCPCGDLCSNQQFQKRDYAGMHWFPTGKKGYGLQLLENVSKGQFLIEYVGEVLDMHAYEARQKQYASDGHKHFYFMTLNGSEVIDASAKGNMGRFINHSCDPNCRTEKWMVNGEICIGLFALRDMKKGEEVTFDYNYVRVFGAAAKKCYCGSLQCQGYIGGDPSNTEVIVQGDSDEEFPEPVMLFEDGKSKGRSKNKTSRTKRAQMKERVLEAGNKIDESTTSAVRLEITSQIDDSKRSAPVDSELHTPSLGKLSSVPEEVSAQTEDATSSSVSSIQEELPMEDESLKKAPSCSQRLDTSAAKLSRLLPDGIVANRKFKPEILTKRTSSKLGLRTKTSRASNSVKKGKANIESQNVYKPQLMPDKSELQSIKPSATGRFESVEVKLNELLDSDGGISKRKDAPKGYLKLLLLTAASGDSGGGEAIQSNRELSMILDALLKTKSRIVLIDIINKNGLRMLHNIMKQYRRDFKKIPILRKLLKVLEYLAVREILTQEHISGGPPCPGMESFTESILSLTEHDDKQVHQIARCFRDKWIPRHLRKLGYGDRADGREFHRGQSYTRFSASPNLWHEQSPRPSDAIDCVKQVTPVTAPVASPGVLEGTSVQCTSGNPSIGTRIRKRKSRWDQPAESSLDSTFHPLKEQKTDSGLQQTVEHTQHCQQDQNSISDDERSNVHDDVPPGFSPPLKPPTPPCGSSSTTYADLPQANANPHVCPEAVTGHPQGRFVSRKPVSYGIPLSIVQQFGMAQAEITESWISAPGIPFYPFPPLPPCPRNKKGPDPPTHAVNHMSTDQPGTCSHPATPNTSGANHPNLQLPGSRTQHSLKRPRGTTTNNDLGKRYFRQQKWSNAKMPPWLWKRSNGWGFGNHARNGAGGNSIVGVGNVENEFGNMYCSEGINCSRVEKPGNNYQHPQHQNHH